MWVLVLVLLVPVHGVNHVTVLNTFSTAEECASERDRIDADMTASYPNDHDFVITCHHLTEDGVPDDGDPRNDNRTSPHASGL